MSATLEVLVQEDDQIDWVELKEDDPERYIELKEKADKRKEALEKIKAERLTPADEAQVNRLRGEVVRCHLLRLADYLWPETR